MPTDKMICVKRGNTSYCWNFETCQLEIYTRKKGTISSCPKDVAQELMALLNEKIKNEETKL